MVTSNDANKTPVPVRRGSGNKILSQKLNWLEVTFRGRNSVTLHPSSLPQKYTETRAFSDYTVGSLYEDGRILTSNPERPAMGTHLLWIGDDCDKMEIDQKELVKHLCDANFSFTRIDNMAMNAINFNLRPQQAMLHDTEIKRVVYNAGLSKPDTTSPRKRCWEKGGNAVCLWFMRFRRWTDRYLMLRS